MLSTSAPTFQQTLAKLFEPEVLVAQLESRESRVRRAYESFAESNEFFDH